MEEEQLLYRVMYEDGMLYGISIVGSPANGFDFVALSDKVKKQQVNFGVDKKKKILYGIVLRPEQKIPRKFDDGTEFLLKFDAETIEKFSQDFIMKGYQKNTSFDHENDKWLKGTSVVEQWIVENGTNDKANEIGLSVMKGDWVVGMKLSDELWNEYIDSGLAKGFSIDSFVRFEKINFKKVEDRTEDKSEEKLEKNKMSVLKKLIKMFSDDVKLASWETDKGVLTADEFSEGNMVYQEDLEVFVGEFIYENKKYITDAEGVIVSIEDVESEMEEEEVPVKETPAEDVEVEMGDKDKEDEEEVKMEEVVLKEKVKKEVKEEVVIEENKELLELKLKFEEMNAKLEEITKENEELKKQPISQKLKSFGSVNPLNFKTIEKSNESMINAIGRITKKNNK